MNLILPVLVAISAFLAGWTSTRLLAPPSVLSKFAWERALLRVALALGLGTAVTSMFFFFLWNVLRIDFTVAAFSYVVVCLFAFIFCRNRSQILPDIQAESPAQPEVVNEKLSRILAVCASILVLSNVALFVYQCHIRPHGDFDAMMDFNLKSLFLFALNGDLRHSLPTELFWSHPEYPLLLPLFIAIIWFANQATNLIVAQAVAFVYTFGTAAIVFSVLSIIKGKDQANFGQIVLLTTPFFALAGTMLIADIPVGFYITASNALLLLRSRLSKQAPALLLLAGLCAGFGMWTKREGVLYVIALLVATVLLELKKSKRLPFEQIPFVIGLLPGAACLLTQKIVWPAVTSFSLNYFEPANFLNLAYWLADIQLYTIQLVCFGQWRISPILLLALYWLFYKMVPEKDIAFATAKIGLTLVLINVAYVLIFMTYGHELSFQIAADAHRLQMQLWPSVLMVLLINVQSPAAILSAKANVSHEPAAQ